MMYKLLVLLAFVLSVEIANAQSVNIAVVREMYFNQDKAKNEPLKLFQMLDKANLTQNYVLIAYKGAAQTAAAGSVDGVLGKLDYFKKGKALLEQAVSAKPLDIEIRFLRLATQLKAPSFLGYTGEIKSDKSLVINTLVLLPSNHSNAYLYRQISAFLLMHGDLSKADKEIVSQLIIKFK